MSHKCNVKPSPENFCPPFPSHPTCWNILKRQLLCSIMIDSQNPMCILYFRSEAAILNAKKSHYNSKYWYMIHPLSKVGIFYEMFLLLFYIFLLIVKPFEFGFVRYNLHKSKIKKIQNMVLVVASTDIVAIFVIVTNFFVGISKSDTQEIVMKPGEVARNYVLSIYFISDLLSSIPKACMCNFEHPLCTPVFYLITNTLIAMKIVRIKTVCILIKRVCNYWGMTNNSFIFNLTFLVLLLLIFHWMACFESAMLQYRYVIEKAFEIHLWTLPRNPLGKSLIYIYTLAMHKSSAQALGIYVQQDSTPNWEENLLSIGNYIVGKLVITMTWIVLLTVILSKKFVATKYYEHIAQLEEYMETRQLPTNLRKRLLDYYNYKYNGRYIDEEEINTFFSSKLRKEAIFYIYKSFVASVPILSGLSSADVARLGYYFKTEIFLQGDVITYSGSVSHSMYFIASGTVAVFTHSGKEICHLEDGGYFGEICLILPGEKRNTTVIAVEVTKVFRLDRNDFNKCIVAHKATYSKMLAMAKERLKYIKKCEAAYKAFLFGKSFEKSIQKL